MNITTLQTIASEAIFQAKCEAVAPLTVECVSREIETQFLVMGIEFETTQAEANAISLVLSQVKNVCQRTYKTIYPQIGMDVNGNYTYDESKWV